MSPSRRLPTSARRLPSPRPLACSIRRLWRPAVLGLAVLALTACGGGDDDDRQAGQPMELTLLHTNDHHSHLDSDSRTLNLRNAAGETVEVEVDAGGFPRLTAAFAELAGASPQVLKLHAGDALTGTLYFSRAGAVGEADAALMNSVCFDAFTLGNHEFDKGDTELRGFIDRLHAGSCQTPVLSANLQPGPNSAIGAARAPGLVSPSVVLERGGQRIGIVGLTIAGKTKESSSPDPDTNFEDEAVAAQREIDVLRGQGIDKIIVMSHIGYTNDKALIAKLDGVDVVVGGDSHSLLGPDALESTGVGTPAGPYAEGLSNAGGDTTCLVQAWEYAQVVGELKVSFDAQGRVTGCAGTPHVLIGDDFRVGDAEASAADAAAFRSSAAETGFLRITAADAGAAALLAPYKSQVDRFRAQVVAEAPEELCSRRMPGGEGSVDYGRSSPACNALGEVSQRGGDIQQWVAQAYLEVANSDYGGADISLQSGGGVRIPLSGAVTAANVIEVLPFANLLWRLEITGDEVKAMVEDGLDAVFRADGSTGPYPYAGGLRWSVDPGAAKGARASNLEVRDAGTGAWAPLDPARSYRLFVLSFNATGGDGYGTLAAVPAERRLDIGVLDADVLQAWIDRQPKDPVSGLPQLRKLDAALYSTRSFGSPE